MKQEWLGLTDYVSAVQLQDKIIDRASLVNLLAHSEAGPGETILGLEHPLTITLGKRADILKDIKAPIRELKAKQVAIVGVERGGQATIHNPGQLVIYPIINLRERGIRVRDYVHALEDVTKRFLADYGVTACCRGEEPGLYTIRGKIAFFGVRVKRGMTSHGVAINVSNNLEDFALIRSCGKEGEVFSSLNDFNVKVELEPLFRLWCDYFQTALGLTQDVNRPMLDKPFNLRV
ncbi:MAG: lipoyl(octanoyl) transferase LipB [Bdellovibrionales bacterium]|nr:lipoyl(octanoyl) transferase LipB [Bdellovibrionales bacterium]